MPSAISASEAVLLESLASGAHPATLAARHNLSLAALALWLREPHVKEVLDALHDLFALHRAAWRDQVIRDTVESLREAMQASPDLPERRRAASHIIRALSSSLSRPRRERAGERATASPSSSPPPPSNLVSPSLDLSASLSCTPVTPVTHSPFPVTRSSADSTADLILTALQHSTEPAALDAVRSMRAGPRGEPAPDDDPAFEASLQCLIAALPGATVSSAPALTEPDAQANVTEPDAQARSLPATLRFTKLYTLAYPDAPPARFEFRLGSDPAANDCWLEEIRPVDTT